MCSLFRFLLLAALAIPVQAMDSIDDFAFKAALTESQQSLQRVVIPLDLMLKLTSRDLDDIAVFNSAGNHVPFAIIRTPEKISQHELELPFHEFSRFQKQRSKTVTTREQNQQQGQLSEMQTTETVAVQKLRKDFLIELAPDENTPEFDYLELDWKHQPAEQILEVKVEVGMEIDQLRTLKTRKSLTNLGSKDITWRSIRGIPRQQKYLRLTPANSVTEFELKQVFGIYQMIEPPPRLIHTLATEQIKIDNTVYYTFELPSAIRPESIRIIPGEARSVITGNVYSSSNNFDTRQLIIRGFRQHNIDDVEVRPSQPLSIGYGNNNQFQIRSAKALSAAPRVELIYAQHEIIFLGDDKSPFTIVWGNHESRAGNADLSGILELDIKDAREQSELVSMTVAMEAGGIKRLAPESDLPWQKWLLWAFLILAAILTGRMALKLYREMNQQESASPEA